MLELIRNELEKSAELKKLVAMNQAADIAKAAGIMIDVYRNGGKVLLAGNGGSAADAQHIAAELTGRFTRERDALPAVALTTDTSVLTALSNDYGFEYIFSRQIEAHGKQGDLFLAITTSGVSSNIIRAVETAHSKGMKVVALTGESGLALKDKAEPVIAVPSSETSRIQEVHITIGHILCLLVEEELFGND